MNSKEDKIIKRLEALQRLRSTWESHWQEVGDYVYPRRRDFISKQWTKGEKKTHKVYDSTAIHANEMLAASVHGMMTNPASRWFKLRMIGTTEEDSATMLWLEDVLDVMYSVFNSPAAGFSTEIFEDYMEYCAFGTSCLFVHDDLGEVRFQTRPLTESYIAEGVGGKVDTVYRLFKYSVRQAVDKFGIENVGKATAKKYSNGKFDDEVEIIHVVEPRKDGKPGRKDSKNLPVASIYMEKQEKHILQEGGYHEMPYLVSRFFKTPLEIYGRSPAMTALPDIKMLNKMMSTTLKAAQKVVDPPLSIPDDGYIYPFTTVPGGLNFRRPGSNGEIQTFGNHGNIPLSLEMMQDVRARIRDTFFIDQLQLSNSPQMTLGEVEERTRRNMRILGPIAGRYQQEKLGPMIDRVFNILMRAGKLPEIPPQLQGKELRVEYQGPLAKAQQQTDLLGVERWIQQATPFVQLDPNAGQKIDAAKALEELANMNGVSRNFFKDDQQYESDMQTQQEAQQGQEALAMAQQGAGVAKDVAQAEAMQR